MIKVTNTLGVYEVANGLDRRGRPVEFSRRWTWNGPVRDPFARDEAAQCEQLLEQHFIVRCVSGLGYRLAFPTPQNALNALDYVRTLDDSFVAKIFGLSHCTCGGAR